MKKIITLLALAFYLNGWAQCAITVNTATICMGQQTATLTASGATSYTWTPATGLSTTTGSVVAANPSVTTSYTVTGTTGTCTAIATTTVTVLTLPALIATSNRPCANQQPLNLNCVPNGMVSYNWTGPNSFTSTLQNPTIPASSTGTNAAGNYTVVTNDANGCYSIATVSATIIPGPIVIATGATVCIGQTINLTAIGGVSYSWNGPNGFTSPLANPIIPNASITSSGYYNVIATDANGCFSANVAQVVVNSLPLVTATSATVCSGASTNLTASGAATYTWSGSGLNPNTGSAVICTASNSQTYVVTATDLNGCINTTVAQVVVNALPYVSYTLQKDTLAAYTWDAYPSYTASATNINWSWGDGATSNLLYPSHTYSAAGTYNLCVTITDANNCSFTYCENDSIYRLANNNSTLSNMVYVNVKNSATGISQISSLNTQISIYPNPSNGIIQLAVNNVQVTEVKIYDVNGRLVLTQSITGKTSIDASNLTNGIYNVSIISNEGVINKRLVITH